MTIVRVDAVEELRDEARLPDAGAAEDRELHARVLGARALPGVLEQLALALAADERRVRAARDTPRRPSATAAGTPSTGSDLPFASIGGTSSASTASRTSAYVGLADQHLARAPPPARAARRR